MTEQTARYLIATADERTWKFDRPVIFLGEWCRIYERRQIWQDMDAIVAAPYGLSQIKKDADYVEARALEEKLFPGLCEVLNQYHGTQHGARFWRIVLGHWLRRYVTMMLNRVKTLELCIQTHQLSGMTAFSTDHYGLAKQDSYAAIWASNDDRWNNALTLRVLNLLGVTAHCPVEIIYEDDFYRFCQNDALAVDAPLKRKVLHYACQKVMSLGSLIARDKDAFIINSYLPKKEEIKLQLALGQWPQWWNSPKRTMSEKPDLTLRKSLANQVISKSGNNLEDILTEMVFELLPVCYLEGFSSLNKLVTQQRWPKNPKFIYTANNFDTDEVFKLWAARKIESGTKYITGQHGNYGIRRYRHPSIEEVTADKFLTWGWTDGLPQHTPAFIFKTAARKAKNYNSQGGLLLIEVCLGHRISTWDNTAEFVNYFEDQQRFISELAGTPKQHLTIRLHAGFQHKKWNEKARWRAFDPSLRIDAGGVAIRALIAQSRLVVHSYDSTGILETLSQNVPTLAFWQNGFDNLRESNKLYYQILVDAGIVHLSPQSVAQKVNEVWDDVEGWWKQSVVQEAREQFCERYARVSQNPVREIKTILKANIL